MNFRSIGKGNLRNSIGSLGGGGGGGGSGDGDGGSGCSGGGGGGGFRVLKTANMKPSKLAVTPGIEQLGCDNGGNRRLDGDRGNEDVNKKAKKSRAIQATVIMRSHMVTDVPAAMAATTSGKTVSIAAGSIGVVANIAVAETSPTATSASGSRSKRTTEFDLSGTRKSARVSEATSLTRSGKQLRSDNRDMKMVKLQ